MKRNISYPQASAIWSQFSESEKEQVFQFVREHFCDKGEGLRQLNQMLSSIAQKYGHQKGVCIICGNKATRNLCYHCKKSLLQTQLGNRSASTWEKFSEEEKQLVIRKVLNGKTIPFSERKKILDDIAASHSGIPSMCVVCGKDLHSKECIAMCKHCQTELKNEFITSRQSGGAIWDILTDEERGELQLFLGSHDCHTTENRRKIGKILWRMVDNHSGKKQSCMVCGDTISPNATIPMCRRCESEKIMSACVKATEHPVWERLSQGERRSILNYADGRLSTKEAQEEFGEHLRKLIRKYKGHLDACIHCGGSITDRFKFPMCRSCRWELGLEVRKTRAGISFSELEYCSVHPVTDPVKAAQLKDNIEPHNLYWAYPSEELFHDVLPLFTPGKPKTREEMIEILNVFEADLQREYRSAKTNRRFCTICGKKSESRSGLCPSCRKFIAENGCPIAMPKGTAVGRKIVSLRSLQMYGDFKKSFANNKHLPLIKVR